MMVLEKIESLEWRRQALGTRPVAWFLCPPRVQPFRNPLQKGE
jgi:hypothetical protein